MKRADITFRKLMHLAYWVLATIGLLQLIGAGYFLLQSPAQHQQEHREPLKQSLIVNEASIHQFLSRSAHWLDTHLSEQGALPYSYDLQKDSYGRENQIIRQWFATLALGRLYLRDPVEPRREAFLKNLRYNMQHYFYRGYGRAYFVHEGFGYLATSAIAARALAIAKTLDARYREDYIDVIRSMEDQLAANGVFDTVMYPVGAGRQDVDFAPGAALVTLMEAVDEGVVKWDGVRMLRAATHYLAQWEKSRSLYAAPWILQGAVAVWMQWQKQPPPAGGQEWSDTSVYGRMLADSIYRIADYMVSCQARPDDNPPLPRLGAYTMPGCHQANHVPLATGVRLEGMIAAYRMAQQNDVRQLADRYRESATLALANILRAQIDDAQSTRYPNPKRALGAMPLSYENPAVRIDAPGHTIMAADAFQVHVGKARHPQPPITEP